jgi:protease secretion system outer membrane protein
VRHFRLPRSAVKRLSQVVAAALLLHSGASHALGLVQAYQDALQNDPTYLGARYEHEVNQQSKVIGRAGLLPSVSASYSQSKNKSDITAPGFGGVFNTTHPEYKSLNASLSLRQPVINFDALARYHQGVAQSQLGDALFAGHGHELMLRLVAGYLDVLFSQAQVALATAQRDTLKEQIKVNELSLKNGDGTRTDVLETQARLDLAEAQLLESLDNQSAARSMLAAVVGHDIGQLDGLRSGFRVPPLQPSDFESWKALTLANNPELQAQTFSIENARQEIKRTRAGHYPRLDFVASYGKTKAETINTITQDAITASIGVQLNVPIYSGGYVNATSKQAVANHQRARADYSAKTDRTLTEVQHQHSVATGSVARVAALDKAVESAQLLIKATEKSIQGGVRINLDLLNAKQQYYVAQRDLTQARFNYLQATMRLYAAAGTLCAADLDKVGAYFGPVK